MNPISTHHIVKLGISSAIFAKSNHLTPSIIPISITDEATSTKLVYFPTDKRMKDIIVHWVSLYAAVNDLMMKWYEPNAIEPSLCIYLSQKEDK